MFRRIVSLLDLLSRDYNMPDHADLNRARYPWIDTLHTPEIYGSRVWEYPWAITEAHLFSAPKALCADVGSGMTPFPIYLERYMGCRVTCLEPDLDDGVHYYGHGVTRQFIKDTGLHVVPFGITDISWWPTDYFDRVFCISVLEHLTTDVQVQGIREMARILAPNGLALITVDVVEHRKFCDIPQLIEESGLRLLGDANYCEIPQEHFGIFPDYKYGERPCDVYGIALRKDA